MTHCGQTPGGTQRVFISSLTFEDFGPFQERTTISCAPITLFFGENGAGKSAILNALSLLKQSANSPGEDNSPLRLSGPTINYGSERSLFFGYDMQRTARIGVHLPVQEADFLQHEQALTERDFGCFHGQEYGFKLAPGDGGRLSLVSVTQYLGEEREEFVKLALTDDTLGKVRDAYPHGVLNSLSHFLEIDYRTFNRSNSILEKDAFYIRGLQPRIDQAIRGALDGLEIMWGESATPKEMDLTAYVDRVKGAQGDDFWPEFLARLKSYDSSTLVEDITGDSGGLTGVSRFSPGYQGIRLGPRFEIRYTNGGVLGHLIRALEDERESIVRRLSPLCLATSTCLAKVLDNLIVVGPSRALPSRVITLQEVLEGPLALSVGRLVTSSDTLDNVNEFAAYLGLNYKLQVKRFDVFGVQDSFVLIARDEKTGVDCTLRDIGYGVSQVLPVLTASIGGSDSLVVIQQPELHLHPRLQARVADAFVVGVEEGNQFLIETHSEHIVYRLQRHIREGLLRASDVSINWIYRDQAGSHCYPIRMDDDGDFIDEWPGGFFEDGFDDIIAGVDD